MTSKEDALEHAISEIEKRFGKGSLFRGGDEPIWNGDVISTGSIGLDKAVGVKGVPRGKLTEIFGEESSGKTTICQQVIANAQRDGGAAAMIDLENAVDQKYAEALGVDFDKFILSQPDTAEQAFEIAEGLIIGGVAVVVIDSVAALVPKSMLEGDYGDGSYGKVANFLSQSLSRLKGMAAKYNSALVFTNQMRVKLGAISPIPGYVPKKTFGGEALRYYADLRIELKRHLGKRAEHETKQDVEATVVKNKLSPPFKTANFVITYGVGIDKIDDIIEVAIAERFIDHKAGWYKYGESKWNGRDAVTAALREDAKTLDEIRKRVIS